MEPKKVITNEDRLSYLAYVLNENNKKDVKKKLFFSINLIRFGNKVPVVYREPAGTDIEEQIKKYSDPQRFNPDFIVIDLFTGRSHNIKNPIATFTLNYKK